jgi:N-acetylneuraminate synthase
MSILSSTKNVYVIAEIGINHNGSMAAAKTLIDASVEAGAHGVKFQVRDLASVYTREVLDDPLKAEQGTQYLLAQLRQSELTWDQIAELYDYSKQYPVDFFATPFDAKSASFLAALGVELFKVGSPDLTNLLLIEELVQYRKPLILSTGMASEEEIRTTAEYLRTRGADFSLLHCSSTYPAAPTDINLRFMNRLRTMTPGKIGYSGHERGYGPTLAAVALGAQIIERHISLDRSGEGPDHRASLEPPEFKAMVEAIRSAEEALGIEERHISQGEMNNRLSLAKSLVAARDLPKGHALTMADFAAKTPAKGISPQRMVDFIGKVLARDIRQDEYFSEDTLGTDADETRTYTLPKTWGIVGRLNDFRDYLALKPDLIEIHMTWRDVKGYQGLIGQYEQDLVVHAPEYYEDTLIDFSATDPEITELSLEMLQRTVSIARDLAPKFKGQIDTRGPRVVVHPGGHFLSATTSDKREQYRRLATNLRSIDTEGVRILVENMPPFPWYFGGQWKNSIFLDPREIAQFAEEMRWGICYDTSHAQLYCAHAGISILDFTRTILNHVQYLHISDAKGVTHEGLQIGEGEIDFVQLFALLGQLDPGFVPEIWQGHLDRGRGFKQALEILETMLSKTSGNSCQVCHTQNCTTHSKSAQELAE